MGYTSQGGQVGFGIESAKGTAVAPTRWARLRSGALAPNRSLLIPDPEIGGNRDIPQAYLGPISFSGSYDFYARMEILALLFFGAFGANTNVAGAAGSAEVQTVTITGTPTGGTFTLSYRGQTTAPIAYNAIAATVQTALQALSTIGAGNATVAGGPGPGTPYVVTFAGTLATGNVRPIFANGGGLTGGTNPLVTVTETTPGGSAITSHVLTPSDAASLPWFTVEERISTSFESFQYTDAKISRVHIECDAGGYMMGTVDLAAMQQLAGVTPTSPAVFDTSPMITGGEVLVYWNGIQLPAKSMNFEVNNNMETDDYRLGSIGLGDITEKRREFKLGASVRPTDASLWREATYGGPALTAARAGKASYGSLTVVANSHEFVGGAVPYSLRIDVPYAAMTPLALSPSGDDVIQHDVEFTLLRDDPLTPICTVTIVNDLATVT